MKVKFIKLRGRPKKNITLSHTQMMFLNSYGKLKIPGYLVIKEQS